MTYGELNGHVTDNLDIWPRKVKLVTPIR